jgi:maltooligosyltrehalose trehalohydrolase
MESFSVWAPTPHAVELVLNGRRVDMERDGRGWWRAAAGPTAGDRYGFSLDGGPPRPDPRSASQPDGVLGLSEVVDHARFGWTDATWRGRRLPGSIIYELHVGTFSPDATFDGVIAHLPHLSTLGVDTVELMPVAEFSGDRGWGYDGVDLYAPHHAYGGPDGLKRLVDACHAGGLAVVLDVVYNHLGPLGNFLPEFGPYFSDRHRTPWGAAVDFDGQDSQEVRRFFVDNATMWLRDYHVDGLRLDAVNAMFDESPTHILEEVADAVKLTGRELDRSTYVVAESNRNDPAIVRDLGLDAVWADDWHHALHAVLTGERSGYYAPFGSLEQLAKALRQAWVRGRGRHDLPPDRFIVAAQNHDQVGNRAAGERLVALVGAEKAKLAAALLLTSPFTPLVFQGEEWAASSPFQYFTDHEDRGLARAVSEGRRSEFQAFGWKPDSVPDPQDPATFERSKLSWDEIDEPRHREMLAWYRRLIAMRRRLPPASLDEVTASAGEESGQIEFGRPGLELRAGMRDGSLSIREHGASFA